MYIDVSCDNNNIKGEERQMDRNRVLYATDANLITTQAQLL